MSIWTSTAQSAASVLRNHSRSISMGVLGGASVIGAAGVLSSGAPVSLMGGGNLDAGEFTTNALMDLYFATQPSSAIPGTSRPSVGQALAGGVRALITPSAEGEASPLGLIAPVAATGAVTGGLTFGGLATAFGRGRSLGSSLLVAGIGAAVGGYQATKLSWGLAKVASGIHKNIIGFDAKKEDRRGYGGGSGYRTWAKSPGQSMPVGHLGATGDLVFAMHKVRNKSMF